MDTSPLRAWRVRHGLTQEEAAKRIGTSKANLSRWELGTRFPNSIMQRRIAAVTNYEVTPNDILLAPNTLEARA